MRIPGLAMDLFRALPGYLRFHGRTEAANAVGEAIEELDEVMEAACESCGYHDTQAVPVGTEEDGTLHFCPSCLEDLKRHDAETAVRVERDADRADTTPQELKPCPPSASE